MTVGEDRVRVTFNPSANTIVDNIKQGTAKLIDMVDGLKFMDPRLAVLAQTAYEEAAMWAVKLATTAPSTSTSPSGRPHPMRDGEGTPPPRPPRPAA